MSVLHESSKIDCRSLYKICGTLKNSDIISVKATVEICKERNGVRDLDSSAFPTFVLVCLTQLKFFVLNDLQSCTAHFIHATIRYIMYGKEF